MKTIIPVLLLLLVLSSCEGFIHMQGVVYDSATKQPVQNSQVLLIMRRKDTVRNIYYEYDTLSYSKRMELRKAGVKDDYKIATGGLAKKPAPAMTDTNGKFTIGTILVPCVPKCPTCKLVVIKDGYKQREVPLSSIVNDSLIVSLERIDK